MRRMEDQKDLEKVNREASMQRSKKHPILEADNRSSIFEILRFYFSLQKLIILKILIELKRCYTSVPDHFFQKDFLFDMKPVTRVNMMDKFEETMEMLDILETARDANINCKFEGYLDAMQNLQSIDQIIGDQAKVVQNLRSA